MGHFVKDHAHALALMTFNGLLGWWATVTLDQAIKVSTLVLLLAQLVFLLRRELFNRREKNGHQTRPRWPRIGRRDERARGAAVENGQRPHPEDHGSGQQPGDAT